MRRTGTWAGWIGCALWVGAWGGALAAPAGAQTPSAAERKAWLADLDAFEKDVQANCSLLSVKRIAWSAVCTAHAAKVRRAANVQQFLAVMQDLVGQLRDGHAYLEPLTVKLPAPPAEQFPGVALAPAPDEQVVIVQVASAATGDAKRLAPGLLVLAIDGKPAWPLLEKRSAEAWAGGGYSSPRRARYSTYRLALAGAAGTTVELLVREPGGNSTPLRVSLTRDQTCWHDAVIAWPTGLQRAGNIAYGLIDGRVGYLHLYRMDTGRNAFDASLTTAMQAVAGAEALVVDVRGNRGGGIGAAFIDTFQADGQSGGVLGQRWQKPLAVLIDPGTFSAGEGAASLFRERTAARLFGETTAGSSSKKRTFKAPSGLFAVTYSWRGQTNFGTQIVEFHGVAPHEPVALTPAVLRAGKDPVIESALAWLKPR